MPRPSSTPRHPYYRALLATSAAGEKPSIKACLVANLDDSTFYRLRQEGHQPPLRCHVEWCRQWPDKAGELKRLYAEHWSGGAEEHDNDSFEQGAVYSGVALELLRARCEFVLRNTTRFSLLDRRFAAEQLATLAEMRSDWDAALRVTEQMLSLQSRIKDDLYLAKAFVRASYCAYKLWRAKGRASELEQAIRFLESAAQAWRHCNIHTTSKLMTHFHPDVKTYIKWLEIGALILARTGKCDAAKPRILEAQELRKAFSGEAGRATGLNRAGVVYSLAKDYAAARDAFGRSIDLRRGMGLMRDAAIVSESLAEVELALGDFSGACDAMVNAHHLFYGQRDYASALRVALKMAEVENPEVRATGFNFLVSETEEACRQIALTSAEATIHQLASRPGWSIWLQSSEAAPQIIKAAIRRVVAVRSTGSGAHLLSTLKHLAEHADK